MTKSDITAGTFSLSVCVCCLYFLQRDRFPLSLFPSGRVAVSHADRAAPGQQVDCILYRPDNCFIPSQSTRVRSSLFGSSVLSGLGDHQRSAEWTLMEVIYVFPMQYPSSVRVRRLVVGSEHTSAADFHLAQLSRLLLPTLTTRVCMHAVLQTAGGTGREGGARRHHEEPSNGTAHFTADSGSATTGASSGAAEKSFELGDGSRRTAGIGQELGAGGGKAAAAVGSTANLDGGVDMWTSLVNVLEVTMALRH